jgi:hypothetical protein
MIINPNPVTPLPFNGMWINRLHISLTGPGLVRASLVPYDGTNLLATGKRSATGSLPEATKSALVAKLKSLDKPFVDPITVDVQAYDPSKPVKAMIRFATGQPLIIPDCYALCAADPEFAMVFSNTMTEIATLAGLEVQ